MESTSNRVKSLPEKLFFQIKLLLWKRYAESTKSRWDLAKLILPAILFFALLQLIYSVFDGLFDPDGVEPFLVPFAFWLFIQRIVIQIMFEKSTRLQESMRMMGLSDVAYWTSYFISDGIITGFILAFLCSVISGGVLFNHANFGEILGLLFVFCLSAVPFAFFLCSFFDTPQTSGQATLALLLGKFANCIVSLAEYSFAFTFCRLLCRLYRCVRCKDIFWIFYCCSVHLLSLSPVGVADSLRGLPKVVRWHQHREHWRNYGEHFIQLRFSVNVLLI